MTESPQFTAGALPLARSQASWQLCRGDSHATSCITSKIENPDFPLRAWKIQKEGGSRLTESVSQDERMP